MSPGLVKAPHKPKAPPVAAGPAWPRVWNGGPAQPVGEPALRFEVELETRNPANGDGKNRWAKIHRTERARSTIEQALTFDDDRIVRLAAAGPWCVRITRLSSAARPLDDDAPPGACKAVRDAVAAALGVDDGSPAVAFAYGQARRKGPLGVRVEVWGAGGLPS